MLSVGSLFSGIGGFDLAAERCGMTVAWQSEIDPFARRVLARHWPDVEQHGDIRAIDPGRLVPVDILCGGWPCQGNSVAGKRGGHADPRSGLFAEILRLIDGMAVRPRAVVLENVPGLVSVRGGRDFADAITALQRRGYVGCVRRLDAQYDGLAQRRKRLLFVGGLGDAGLRAVQLVTEGGRRDLAPRREAGEGVAPTLESGANRSGGDRPPGTTVDTATALITARATGRGYWNDDGLADLRAHPGGTAENIVAAPLRANGPGVARAGDSRGQDTLVTHALTGEGFDASEDGTGRGTPLVAFSCKDSGQDAQQDLAPTLRAMPHDGSHANGGGQVAVCFQMENSGSNGDNHKPEQAFTLNQTTRQAIAYQCQGSNVGEMGTLRAGRGDVPSGVPFVTNALGANCDRTYDSTGSGGTGPYNLIPAPTSVRRLTPTECERLQGFSWRSPSGEWQDGFTCLCGRNRGRSWPEDAACTCPDGPRYRALGNAVAVPVLVWIFLQVLEALGGGS